MEGAGPSGLSWTICGRQLLRWMVLALRRRQGCSRRVRARGQAGHLAPERGCLRGPGPYVRGMHWHVL